MNAARCLICGDTIESKSRHDYQTCSCGNVSVDGGQDYKRRIFRDSSKYIEVESVESVPIGLSVTLESAQSSGEKDCCVQNQGQMMDKGVHEEGV